MFASTAFPRIPLFSSEPAASESVDKSVDKPPVVPFDALVRAAKAPCHAETTRRNAVSIARYEDVAVCLDDDAREFLAALVFLGTRSTSQAWPRPEP